MASSNTPGVQSKYAASARRMNMRMVQNVLLIWLDVNIDESNTDCQNDITSLRQVISTINTFTDADQCVDFLEEVQDDKVCMVISGSLGDHIVPCIHDISQVDSIFIVCANEQYHEQWVKDWFKVKGVYSDIKLICAALNQSVKDCEQNAIGFSLVATDTDFSNMNLDRLDPMFMYTQIIKEILLVIKFEQKHLLDFTQYCRELFKNDDAYRLTKVQTFEHDYLSKTPIWWYTSEVFLYSMLNRALRLSNIDAIVKMGFFIGDVHQQINELYIQQCGDSNAETQFVVYRGQGMSKEELEKISKTKGGLIAFNNFLSTSTTESVATIFVESVLSNPELLGVLFEMRIHSKQSTAPFASVAAVGAFGGNEDEILFAMHAVFRIRDVQPMDENARLFRVKLELTSDTDQDLQVLTKYIRDETFPDAKGWDRLALVLRKLGEPKQAEEIHRILLEQAFGEKEKGYYYCALGICKQDQGQYEEAIRLYQKSFVIAEKYYPNSPSLAASYNNIGVMYDNMGEYVKALSSHEKALAVQQQSLPPNHPSLAASYNNIGMVYENMGEYAKALSSYEKALSIRQQSLPPNHPDLAASYNNIGMVYDNMDKNVKALSSYEKALSIQQQSLPPNHPSLATSYNNIGMVYDNMGEYVKALSSHEKALATRQQSLPPNHPSLAGSYNNIGMVYNNMGEYITALSSHEKALSIQQQSLPPDHSDLAASYNNIGMAYDNMSEYVKALSSHEKALSIRQQSLPLNHPSLAASYNNIGMVYDNMGEYAKALSSYEKALAIRQQSLLPNHPSLAGSYNNIGNVYCNMGEYVKALSSYEKALAIRQQSLPPNHPDLAASYNNIGVVYENMGEYITALSSYEKAVSIRQESLPPNHPHLAMSYGHIGNIYITTGEYSKAFSLCKKAVAVAEQSLPPNHPHLKWYKNNLDRVKNKL